MTPLAPPGSTLSVLHPPQLCFPLFRSQSSPVPCSPSCTLAVERSSFMTGVSLKFQRCPNRRLQSVANWVSEQKNKTSRSSSQPETLSFRARLVFYSHAIVCPRGWRVKKDKVPGRRLEPSGLVPSRTRR